MFTGCDASRRRTHDPRCAATGLSTVALHSFEQHMSPQQRSSFWKNFRVALLAGW
jgi:hypothetical protein